MDPLWIKLSCRAPVGKKDRWILCKLPSCLQTQATRGWCQHFQKTWKLLPVVDMKDIIKCINTTCISIYPVLRPKLTLIQPTWSAYPYHLVFLIWYPYSLVFLIWYPYALISLYGNTAHCSGWGVAMGCYGLSIVARTAIVTSQWYDRYCFAGYARTWARHPATPWQRECTAITITFNRYILCRIQCDLLHISAK